MRLSVFLVALLPSIAAAAVADSSANGFTVKITVNIQAPPDDVYRKLVRNIGDWWSSSHTFSGDAHNLSLDDKAPGCLCERLPGGGSARHLEVVNVAPGKTLVLNGGMGPLQSLAATGSMTFQLSPATGGTKLDLTYAVAGYLPAGINVLAGPVDTVLTEQVTRLKNFVEQGNPAPK